MIQGLLAFNIMIIEVQWESGRVSRGFVFVIVFVFLGGYAFVFVFAFLCGFAFVFVLVLVFVHICGICIC